MDFSTGIIFNNLANIFLVLSGAPLLLKVYRGHRITPFAFYFYMAMIPRCAIATYYYISSVNYELLRRTFPDEMTNENWDFFLYNIQEPTQALWYIPCQAFGFLFSLFFVAYSISSLEQFQTFKPRILLTFAIIVSFGMTIPLFFDPYYNYYSPTGTLLVFWVIAEIVLYVPPVRFILLYLKNKNLYDCYIPIVFTASVLIITNCIIGSNYTDLALMGISYIASPSVCIVTMIHFLMTIKHGQGILLPNEMEYFLHDNKVVRILGDSGVRYGFILKAQHIILFPQLVELYKIEDPEFIELRDEYNECYGIAFIIPAHVQQRLKFPDNIPTFGYFDGEKIKNDITIDVE